jgi:hypothetical protein
MTKKTFLITLTVVLALGAIGGGAYLIKQRQEIREKAAPATKIYFQPSTISTKPSEDFSLSIMVNTGENSLAAVSLKINYDQNLLEAKAFNFETSLLPTILKTPDLSRPGEITADAGICANSTGINNIQKIATITFTTKQAGPQMTKVIFNQSSTKASTAISLDLGANLITSYGEAQVNIASSSLSPSPSPTAEPTSTISPNPTTTEAPTATTSPASTVNPTTTPTATITPATSPTTTPVISQVGIGENPTATPTTSVTSTPTPTTYSPTTTATTTSTSTPTEEEELPVPGSITPTIILIISGVAFIFSFLFIF